MLCSDVNILGFGIMMYVGGFGLKIVKKWVTFYGMELPWVGAFTEKWGSRYRNPVQNLGQKSEIHVKLGFPGLV